MPRLHDALAGLHDERVNGSIVVGNAFHAVQRLDFRWIEEDVELSIGLGVHAI